MGRGGGGRGGGGCVPVGASFDWSSGGGAHCVYSSSLCITISLISVKSFFTCKLKHTQTMWLLTSQCAAAL